jgi:hypothetical protein
MMSFRIWLNYLSLFKWGYESMMVNALRNYVSYPGATNEQVLTDYSMQGIDRGRGIGVLIAFTVFFRLFFWYRLVSAFNGSRKS